MRFMMLIKADADSEAGILPSKELFAKMSRYNEEMADAGVLLAAEGLHPTSKGARVRFADAQATVVHGPFSDRPSALIAGFWLLEVGSKDEAIQWASRCPQPDNGAETEIEVRQVFDAADFPDEVMSAEETAREQELREGVRRRGVGG